MTMDSHLSLKQLSQRMRDLVFGGHLGPSQGKYISSDMVREDDTSVTFIAALIDITDIEAPWNRFLIRLTKADGALLSTTPVSIDRDEMSKILQNAGCGGLVEYGRFRDGSFGTTYKAMASKADGNTEDYVVQLRYHARVDHMYHLIRYIREKGGNDLPVPRMFPIPTTALTQCELGIQVSQFVPGTMGSQLFIRLSKESKLNVIKQVARVFAALWDLDIPGTNKAIGEAIVSAEGTISVGPERRHGFGGPFPSVSSFLQAWIRHRVKELQDQGAIDEYKDKYLQPILHYVESDLDRIPPEVEDVNLALAHTDMGLHNMIFSDSSPHKLQAVIDWEFVDYAPVLIAIPTLIEPIFELAMSDDWPTAVDDLRTAFWNEIPKWKALTSTKGSQIFLDLYSFGFYLKANGLLDRNADLAAKQKHWEKNTNFVENFLARWEKTKISN